MADDRLLENDPVFIKLEELDDKDLYDEMLELINEIPRHRWNLELICTAASALNNSKRFDEAERLLEEEKGVFITDEDKARWYYLSGYSYYGKEELKKAKELALEALKWNPKSECSQDLLLWCKQLWYEDVLDGTRRDEDFSWIFLLNTAFYDSWLLIKGTEDSILEQIQIFNDLNPEDSNVYEFSCRMTTDSDNLGPFMILACPKGVKTGDLLNFTHWFGEQAFLLAYHRQEKRFSFMTTPYAEEPEVDALSLHFENNLAAFLSVPNDVGKEEIETGFNEDTSYHMLQTVCQEFQVSKEDLDEIRKTGWKKPINFIIW